MEQTFPVAVKACHTGFWYKQSGLGLVEGWLDMAFPRKVIARAFEGIKKESNLGFLTSGFRYVFLGGRSIAFISFLNRSCHLQYIHHQIF